MKILASCRNGMLLSKALLFSKARLVPASIVAVTQEQSVIPTTHCQTASNKAVDVLDIEARPENAPLVLLLREFIFLSRTFRNLILRWQIAFTS